MPEMIVPKSSHDRFCSKKSSQTAPSTITNPESGLTAAAQTNGRKRLKNIKKGVTVKNIVFNLPVPKF